MSDIKLASLHKSSLSVSYKQGTQRVIIIEKSPTHLPTLHKNTSRTPNKLRINLNQTLELPGISRFHTPHPNQILHSNFQEKSIFSSPSETPQLINLEKVQEIEEKLWDILNKLKADEDVTSICGEYWELTEDEAIWNVEKLFREVRMRKSLRNTIILESCAIAALAHSTKNKGIWTGIANQARHMINYVHQNFLTLVDIILSRLPPEFTSNAWAATLQQTVRAKKSRISTKKDYSTYLKNHCDVISNCIKTICRLLPSNGRNGFQYEMVHILNNLDKYSISSARSHITKLQSQSPKEFLPNFYMQQLDAPYLPQVSGNVYTLVLDLDETLVHFKDHGKSGQLLIRPYCREFLKEMAQWYEIVVFTAGIQEYADWAINVMDIDHCVNYRLYRQHTIQAGPVFIKDLRKLGRPLTSVIIIDNMAVNFQLQAENGIYINSWIGDEKDKALMELAPLLVDIAHSNTSDVRVSLRKMKEEIEEKEEFSVNLSGDI